MRDRFTLKCHSIANEHTDYCTTKGIHKHALVQFSEEHLILSRRPVCKRVSNTGTANKPDDSPDKVRQRPSCSQPTKWNCPDKHGQQLRAQAVLIPVASWLRHGGLGFWIVHGTVARRGQRIGWPTPYLPTPTRHEPRSILQGLGRPNHRQSVRAAALRPRAAGQVFDNARGPCSPRSGDIDARRIGSVLARLEPCRGSR